MKELFRKIFKKARDEFFTIPNMLSVVRILLIPVIVYLYVFKKDNLWTLIVVALSSLTDVVDGFIARRFNMITDLGKFLDPLADKATQLTVIACLITRFKAMVVPFVILAVKELSALLMRFVVYKRTERVEGAKWHGKASTTIIISIVALHLIWGSIPSNVSLILIAFCSVFMTFSAILYGIESINMLKEDGKQA